MSAVTRKRRRRLTNDSLALGLDQRLSFIVHLSGEPDARVGGLETT
jgi:hypothetical protein